MLYATNALNAAHPFSLASTDMCLITDNDTEPQPPRQERIRLRLGYPLAHMGQSEHYTLEDYLPGYSKLVGVRESIIWEGGGSLSMGGRLYR